MSEKTNIAWASHTASPWFGCSKVSPGCTNCYAEQLTLQKKWAGWGDNSPRVRSKGFWKDAYRLNRKADDSVGMGFNRPRMFTSLMDWLDPKAPIEWLSDFLKVVHDCENLDWLLLTKRPELFWDRLQGVLDSLKECPASYETFLMDWSDGFPPENVWVGATVENQQMANKRIPVLLDIPAKIHWLSVEPLLSPVELWRVCGLTLNRNKDHSIRSDGNSIDWVVVGGESGKNRRDCGPDAISNVAYQCLNAGVPVFVKQDCAFKPGQKGRLCDDVWALKQYPKCP